MIVNIVHEFYAKCNRTVVERKRQCDRYSTTGGHCLDEATRARLIACARGSRWPSVEPSNWRRAARVSVIGSNLRRHREREVIAVAAFVIGFENIVATGKRRAVGKVAERARNRSRRGVVDDGKDSSEREHGGIGIFLE